MAGKNLNATFIGSFFGLNQLPTDARPHVALAGRSNVGKSSLLNKLVGSKGLAKVSSTPGKTRSLNFFLVNEAFYLVDLPGYGYAKVSKSIKAGWGKLIEDYLTRSEQLAGLILLLDSRRKPTPEDLELLGWLAAREIPALLVITKSDKLNRDELKRKIARTETELQLHAVASSVKSGVGKNEIVRAIGELVNEFSTR